MPEALTYPKMDPEVKARWVQALRSGKYHQGTSTLRSRRDHYPARYCCLGVLCEVVGVEWEAGDQKVQNIGFDRASTDASYDFGRRPVLDVMVFHPKGTFDNAFLPDELAERLGIGAAGAAFKSGSTTADDVQYTLSELNDAGGKSFDEIADWVEENL